MGVQCQPTKADGNRQLTGLSSLALIVRLIVADYVWGGGVGFRLGPPPPSACPLLPPLKVADSAGLQDSISPQACCRVGAWACLMPPTFPGSPPTSPCGQGPHSPSRACGLLGPCRFTPAPTGRFLKTSWLTSTRAQCIEKRHEDTLLAWREGRGA